MTGVFGTPGRTFHCHVDAGRQEKPSEAVVEDLVALQSGCGVVCDLDTCGEDDAFRVALPISLSGVQYVFLQVFAGKRLISLISPVGLFIMAPH